VRGCKLRQPSEPVSKSELGAEAEEAANIRPIGRPKKDCYGLTIVGCGDTSGAQLLGTEALALMRGELGGRGKMNGRKAWGLKRTKLQRLRMQSRLEQPQSSR